MGSRIVISPHPVHSLITSPASCHSGGPFETVFRHHRLHRAAEICDAIILTVLQILTIGHSTHSIADFVEILIAHRVEQLADVRTIPRSRRNPQFSKDQLAKALAAKNIGYFHIPGLGGLRHPQKDSINTAWQNASFRGYADYMQTPEFEGNLGELIRLAAERRTAIMCAEAVPWRCHRSLVADALTAHGVVVEHIMNKTTRKPHTFTPFAKVEGQTITYPGLADLGED
jgi:uncharacterized protein (DUF488 family)